jgi:hypothetical protein
VLSVLVASREAGAKDRKNAVRWVKNIVRDLPGHVRDQYTDGVSGAAQTILVAIEGYFASEGDRYSGGALNALRKSIEGQMDNADPDWPAVAVAVKGFYSRR